jgi:hypothetical protein
MPLHDAYAKGRPGVEKASDRVQFASISQLPRHFVSPTFGYLSARRPID